MAYFALIDSVGLGSLKNTHEMKKPEEKKAMAI